MSRGFVLVPPARARVRPRGREGAKQQCSARLDPPRDPLRSSRHPQEPFSDRRALREDRSLVPEGCSRACRGSAPRGDHARREQLRTVRVSSGRSKRAGSSERDANVSGSASAAPGPRSWGAEVGTEVPPSGGVDCGASRNRSSGYRRNVCSALLNTTEGAGPKASPPLAQPRAEARRVHACARAVVAPAGAGGRPSLNPNLETDR